SSCACLLILGFASRLPQKAGRERPLSPGRKSPADRFATLRVNSVGEEAATSADVQVYLLLSPAEEGNLKHDQSILHSPVCCLPAPGWLCSWEPRAYQQSNTDQQMSFRNRWSSSTSSRIASGSWSRCHRHSSRPALSPSPSSAAARAALIA